MTPEQAVAYCRARKAEETQKSIANQDVSSLPVAMRETVWRNQYSVVAGLRDEFRSVDVYLAYKRAQFSGLTR